MPKLKQKPKKKYVPKLRKSGSRKTGGRTRAAQKAAASGSKIEVTKIRKRPPTDYEKRVAAAERRRKKEAAQKREWARNKMLRDKAKNAIKKRKP